jgi:hypothetical protein
MLKNLEFLASWTQEQYHALPFAAFLLISFFFERFYSPCSKTLNIKADKKNCNQNLYNFINSFFVTEDRSRPGRRGCGLFRAAQSQ